MTSTYRFGLPADIVVESLCVGCAMDFVTVIVAGLIVAAYVVGSLTSSVDTETELPHLYR